MLYFLFYKKVGLSDPLKFVHTRRLIYQNEKKIDRHMHKQKYPWTICLTMMVVKLIHIMMILQWTYILMILETFVFLWMAR